MARPEARSPPAHVLDTHSTVVNVALDLSLCQGALRYAVAYRAGVAQSVDNLRNNKVIIKAVVDVPI